MPGPIDSIESPRLGQAVPERSVDSPERIREAASQFEALLVSQLLKQARQAGSSGWLGDGEDTTITPIIEIAEEHLARALTRNGGLGISEVLVKGLNKDNAPLRPKR